MDTRAALTFVNVLLTPRSTETRRTTAVRLVLLKHYLLVFTCAVIGSQGIHTCTMDTRASLALVYVLFTTRSTETRRATAIRLALFKHYLLVFTRAVIRSRGIHTCTMDTRATLALVNVLLTSRSTETGRATAVRLVLLKHYLLAFTRAVIRSRGIHTCTMDTRATLALVNVLLTSRSTETGRATAVRLVLLKHYLLAFTRAVIRSRGIHTCTMDTRAALALIYVLLTPGSTETRRAATVWLALFKQGLGTCSAVHAVATVYRKNKICL